MPLKPTNRGMTLAEILMAFFLLTLMTLFVIAMFTAGMRHYKRMDITSTVDALGQRLMDETMAAPLSEVNSRAGNFEAPFADYAYNLEVNNFSGTMDKISLTVTGPEGVARSMDALRGPPFLDPGMLTFMKYDCWTCHHLSSLPSAYQMGAGLGTGPDLDSVGWRAANERITDPLVVSILTPILGHTPTAEEYVRNSIRESQTFHVAGYSPTDTSGYQMPVFDDDILPDYELDMIVNFLMSLDTPP